MSRRQKQQRAGVASHDVAEAIDQHRLFAFERAARHQQWTNLLPPHRRREWPKNTWLFRWLDLEFQVPAHLDSLRGRSNLHQTPRVFIALRQEYIHVLHHAIEQIAKAQVARERPV